MAFDFTDTGLSNLLAVILEVNSLLWAAVLRPHDSYEFWSVLLPYCFCFSCVILSFGTDCCWSHSELCQTAVCCLLLFSFAICPSYHHHHHHRPPGLSDWKSPYLASLLCVLGDLTFFKTICSNINTLMKYYIMLYFTVILWLIYGLMIYL